MSQKSKLFKRKKNEVESQRLDESDSEELAVPQFRMRSPFSKKAEKKRGKAEATDFFSIYSKPTDEESTSNPESEDQSEFARYQKLYDQSTKSHVDAKNVMITLQAIRVLTKKHKVPEPIVFHALFVLNGNLDAADKYLDSDIPIENLSFLPWTPAEDECLLSGERGERYDSITEKRGQEACLERYKFLKENATSRIIKD